MPLQEEASLAPGARTQALALLKLECCLHPAMKAYKPDIQACGAPFFFTFVHVSWRRAFQRAAFEWRKKTEQRDMHL
jgi:hypothetical protein